jgi:cytochrome c oxidase subunit 1
MASAPVDIPIHDTYFIVAHLHYVLFGGSLFAIFAGITYWFPKMFGRMFGAKLGKAHFWLTFFAYNLVFFPMHSMGLKGHIRRIYDPSQYTFLQSMQSLNTLISLAAFFLIAAQLIFAFNFFWSMFRGEKAVQNPWNSNTLEWALAPTPPPHGNFVVTPQVYRGPYEYSSPESTDDFLPQHLPPDQVQRQPVPQEPGSLPTGD